MVARHYSYVCLGVALLYLPTYVADARSSVAAARFCEDILSRHVGQLLLHDVAVVGRGYNINIVIGNDVAEAVGGELEERAPRAENVEELFG